MLKTNLAVHVKPELTLVAASYHRADILERLLDYHFEHNYREICKLHEPAIQGNSLNLTIDYIVRFGNWGPDAERIKKIVARLEPLFKRIKLARNKVLAHNDLEALMDSSELGEFPEGLDEEYFLALQELVNEVHEKWLDGPYPFNDLARVDALGLLNILEKAKRGAIEQKKRGE